MIVLDSTSVSLEASVHDVMSREFDTIQADSFAEEAVDLISQKSTGCLVVVTGNQAVGIITEQDIITRITANRVDPSKIYAKDIMSTPVITVRDDDTLTEAAGVMTQYKVNRLVVVEQSGAVAGLITTEDLTSWLSKGHGTGQTLDQPKNGEQTETLGPYR
jgi:predicted transcriptional regulator